MNIVDTHIHVWDFDKAEYSWLQGNTTILNRNYSLQELEPERVNAGVTHGVLVQAANNREDTNWMLEAAAANDWIKGVVGWLPLLQPHHTKAEIALRSGNPYFKGVRHLIHDEPDAQWLLQPSVMESLKMVAEARLTYDVVGTQLAHLQVALNIADAIPSLKLMLDHLNQPPLVGTVAWGHWCQLMQEAAKRPNMYAKISGLGTAISKGEKWNATQLQPAIAFVLQNFGTERCCLGGDWPVSLLAGTYAYTWQQYQSALTTLNDVGSLENVFFTTAKNFYKL